MKLTIKDVINKLSLFPSHYLVSEDWYYGGGDCDCECAFRIIDPETNSVVKTFDMLPEGLPSQYYHKQDYDLLVGVINNE